MLTVSSSLRSSHLARHCGTGRPRTRRRADPAVRGIAPGAREPLSHRLFLRARGLSANNFAVSTPASTRRLAFAAAPILKRKRFERSTTSRAKLPVLRRVNSCQRPCSGAATSTSSHSSRNAAWQSYDAPDQASTARAAAVARLYANRTYRWPFPRRGRPDSAGHR